MRLAVADFLAAHADELRHLILLLRPLLSAPAVAGWAAAGLL